MSYRLLWQRYKDRVFYIWLWMFALYCTWLGTIQMLVSNTSDKYCELVGSGEMQKAWKA